ncbi:MAG: insulinase family protein [Candidatus Aenigmarchaeota archaeon]|nr:insulinase family protein [Candidatus Aenigmarchaeota archaeon]
MRTVLSNGLTVLSQEHDNSRNTYVSLCIKAGYAHDPAGKSGLSHLVEHLTVFGGTMRQNNFEIAKNIAGAIGELKGGTTCTYQTIDFSARPKFLPKLLKTIRDKIITTEYNEEFVSEQARRLIELLSNVENPIKRTDDILKGVLLGGWWPDEIPSFENITRTDAAKFKQTYFVPNNMILIIAGDFEQKALHKKIEKIFGSLEPKDVPVLKNPDFSNKEETFQVQHYGKLAYVEGGKICKGPLADTYSALECVRTILYNGYQTGKLFCELSIKKGLCYSLDVSNSPITSSISLFSWSSEGCHPDKVSVVRDIFGQQLQSMADGVISKDELNTARKYLLDEIDGKKEDSESSVECLLHNELFGVPTHTRQSRELLKIDRKDIQDIVQKELIGDYTTAVLIPSVYQEQQQNT